MSRIVLIVMAVALAACTSRPNARDDVRRLTGGEPDRGASAIGRYGCGSCHDIPGVQDAAGTVGPPLGGIASRAYLAGHVQNTPAGMMRWIQKPQAIDEGTLMPDLGVTDQDARDIAAYLYTLR